MTGCQTLLLLPCNVNKLQKRKLAISSRHSSAKLGIAIGDGKFFVYFDLYMEVSVMFDHVICVCV